jgi:predicted nucleotidyltransferase
MKAVKITTESPELAERFNRVLNDTVEALEGDRLRYVFIGGIASGGLGRPRSTQDIDVFVRPEDAELTLRALAKNGFRTEKTDPIWLYKGFKENILVDVIFKSKGEIYLDSEMYQRSSLAEFHGKRLRLVAAEDLVIIKAAAHSELTPGHWHDALALLSHATLDWDYLIHRAKRAPRRVLSLLLYAQSNDILVPKSVIDQLFRITFGDVPGSHRVSHAPFSAPLCALTPAHEENLVPRLRERLAEDPRTNELDIVIEHRGDRLLLRGDVMTNERRDAVVSVVTEYCPGMNVENQIRIAPSEAPTTAEDIFK